MLDSETIRKLGSGIGNDESTGESTGIGNSDWTQKIGLGNWQDNSKLKSRPRKLESRIQKLEVKDKANQSVAEKLTHSKGQDNLTEKMTNMVAKC